MAGALPPGYTTAMLSTSSQGAGVIAGVTLLAFLALASTCLRLASRRLKSLDLGADDWLMLAAVPFALALAVVTGSDTRYGLGKHVLTVSKAEAPSYAQLFLATQILWAISTPIVKLSILVLYLRIFGSSKWLRWTSWALITYTLCWMIAVCITLGLQCMPIQKVWDPTIAGKCINSTAFYKAGSATDVIGDFAILVLPIPAVWDLQMPTKKKLGLTAVFVLGSLACIISLVRLIELVHALNGEKDLTWSATLPSIWSVAEPCLGMFCANLPTMRPFVQYMTKSYYKFTSRTMTSRRGYSGQSRDSRHNLSGTRNSGKSRFRVDERGFRNLRDSDDGLNSVTVQTTTKEQGHELELAKYWDRNARQPDKIYRVTTVDVETR